MPFALASLLSAPQKPQGGAPIPVDAGLTIVQSVSGDASQSRDYESVITVRSPTAAGVALASKALVKGRPRDLPGNHGDRTLATRAG